jgi:hypothetical protein
VVVSSPTPSNYRIQKPPPLVEIELIACWHRCVLASKLFPTRYRRARDFVPVNSKLLSSPIVNSSR